MNNKEDIPVSNAENLKGDEPKINVDFNVWIEKIESELQKYPDNLQVNAAIYLYEQTFKRIKAKVDVTKQNLSIIEKTLDSFPYIIED